MLIFTFELFVEISSPIVLLLQSVYWDQWYSYVNSAEFLCEMKTDKMYLGIGQAGGRERAREQIRGERSSVGGEEKWHGWFWPLVESTPEYF